MIFVGGAIAGAVVGLIVGAISQRRSGGASVFEHRSLATVIALLALVVAGIALANSERDRGRDTAGGSATNATTTTGTAAVDASTTTTTTTPGTSADALVIVPNVSHPPLTRKDAEAALKRAHLAVTVQTLTLANVPPGFVISQNPLPEATAAAGSTVTLVVSAAA